MEINKEQVNHPQHYGGQDNPYEAIKVIDAWELGFSLGNTVKYISRAGKKGKDKELEDLRKALWYLQHHIETLEENRSWKRNKCVGCHHNTSGINPWNPH